MSAATPEPKGSQGLRVAVIAADPKRRRELVQLVGAAGHTVETEASGSLGDGLNAADVVLADHDVPVTLTPLVTLGADDRDQAGSLPRDATSAQIDAALRAAAAGLTVRPTLLTPREVEILSSIAAGLGNKAIARNLNISLHTVKFHVESLFRKLDAGTRAEAVAKGLARRRAETIDL
jgi:DNA-binding CsgD family transcriptional regulator